MHDKTKNRTKESDGGGPPTELQSLLMKVPIYMQYIGIKSAINSAWMQLCHHNNATVYHKLKVALRNIGT